MLRQPTIDRLRELRLRGMADSFVAQSESPDAVNLSFEERLGLLVDAEWTHRRNTTLTRLLREAKLRIPACPEDAEFGATRGLDRAVWRTLFAGEFIAHHQNVIIVGATGVGKTYLACALGHACCRLGMRARYLRLSGFLQDVAMARADGSYGQFIGRISKADLLILDDFGLSALSGVEARELLEIIDERYERRSTVMFSQLPLGEWHRAITDPTVADAILDRLVHGAHKFTLSGESMRKKKGGTAASKTVEDATL